MTILVWRTIHSEFVLMLVKGDDKIIWAATDNNTEEYSLVKASKPFVCLETRTTRPSHEEVGVRKRMMRRSYCPLLRWVRVSHLVKHKRYLDGRTKRASFMVALALVCEWIWLGCFENDTGQTSDPTNSISVALYMYMKSKILKWHQSFLFFKH